MESKIGAHLSIAGGATNALHKIVEIGGNCLQIFSSSPRVWQSIAPTQESIQEFVELKHTLQIDPIYFHATYLINLADKERIGEYSKKALITELQSCPSSEIRGTIIHLGSFKSPSEDPKANTYGVLLKNIQEVLDQTPEESLFIIENAGNRKIGHQLNEIAFIVKQLNNKRVRVCLDTCHLHASGYDLSSRESFDRYFDTFEETIGLDKLEVIQVNDSRDALGSFRDRHENIGEGFIPPMVFDLLLNDSRTRDLPFILETPGQNKLGPDKENIDRLKQFIR